jgi:FkbM family methyltransferase
VPRHLARLNHLWRTNAGLRSESREAYSAYHGGDVIDVGAFHGWYSVLLSSRAKVGDRLVSIEPDSKAMPALYQTLAVLATFSPEIIFVPLPFAVGNGQPLTVSFPQGPEGHPRFGNEPGQDLAKGITVDAIVRELGLRPTFVKVDVEGAELFVLEGMKRTLAEYRPTVMLEVHPYWQPVGKTVENVRDLLLLNGYSATTLDVAEWSVRELWTVQGGQVLRN